MSRLRRTVVPFRWSSVALTFTQGTASSVSLSAFLTNPQGRTITYSVVGTLPTGVTHSAGTVSYNGTSPIATGSVQFRATSGGFIADSSPAPIVIQASVSNTAPIWQGATPSSLGNFVEGVGGTYNLAQHAFDAEGDPIRYYRTGSAADTAPGTFVVNETTGVLTVPSGPSGAYSLEIALAPFVGQVTGLAASPTSYTVALTWVAATLATGYRIERSPDGTTWTEIGTSVTPSFTDTNLTPSTVYRYRVRATDGTNFGSYSSTVTATTLAAPSGLFEPAILNEPQAEQYRTIDDLGDVAGEKIGGISADSYYVRLGLRWRNSMGDYIGHDGTLPTIGADVSQGGNPFCSGSVASGVGYKTFDVAAIVSRALATGKNKGWFLRMTGTNGPSVTWAGRLSANPPLLSVTTSAGVFSCPCILSTRMGTDTVYPINGTVSFTNSTTRNGVLQFDLSGVTGTVTSATLSLYANALFGSARTLQVFELDPPTFQVGAGSASTTHISTDGKTGVPAGQVALGIAASLGENNLAASDGTPLHPDIYCAGHFAGTTFESGRATPPRISGFAGIAYDNAVEIVQDPDAPGTSYWRGTAVNVLPGSTNRGLFKKFYEFTPALTSDSRYPIDVTKKVEECYVRAYFMFESDWLDKDEGIKALLGIRCQFGYWVPTSTPPFYGYWEPEGGNSNSYGDGMKHFGDCHDGGGTAYAPDGAPSSSYYFHHGSSNIDTGTGPYGTRYVYKGTMQFGLSGYTGRTLQYDGVADPHWDVRRIQAYNYNIDAPDVYGQGQSTLGNLVPARIRLGQWFCLEQYLKMNTVDTTRPIYGKKDNSFYDNYEANPDGIHRTWLNGVLIDEKTNFRWRRNMDMGIQGAGIEFYTGGNGTTNWPVPGHFRINHVVVSKRYIGPRVRP